MIKFSFDPYLSSQIHYINTYFKQPEYKKQIHHNKSLVQVPPAYPVISAQDQSLHLTVKTVEQSETLERRSLEHFIQEKYQQVHQATVSTFSAPLFAGYHGAEMQVVIGMQHLNKAYAFLEQYLDEPVENTLSKL